MVQEIEKNGLSSNTDVSCPTRISENIKQVNKEYVGLILTPKYTIIFILLNQRAYKMHTR